MCVFSVAYRVFPDCPIFVLTNRDESTARPTISPRSFEPLTPNGDRWFGGADQKAGGLGSASTSTVSWLPPQIAKSPQSLPIRARAAFCVATCWNRRLPCTFFES